MKSSFLLALAIIPCCFNVHGQKNSDKGSSDAKMLYDQSTVADLSFRSVGPALTSGRVVDIAVHPTNKDWWYIAAGSGGVWKTKNHGITFDPIFDGYGSYSIGCLTLSNRNPNILWVGTGENNNQRSVSYGDGIYKSVDGGASFTNMGLKNSEHIGKIVVHPDNDDVVWVACYGPLWKSGGDRGVYKTVDGGKTWKRTLFVSDETGISEVLMDPKNPQILYASAHQRRRHEWTYIGGGPESALYKSTDGGETWRLINDGLPKGEMGRIGLAIAPSDAQWIYAIVEARYGKGGVFLSMNQGETWSKQSSFSTSGNYYQEIICDPLDKKKVFAMDTYMHHSEDAGKNFKATGESHKHVDNHALWIDPSNTDHWLVGCDGGVYETYTHAREWRFFDNLPITQFYKVTTDNDYPFYHIYGGTQDNNSMGGPSGTLNVTGILNTDWFITNGGDGFESATDWEIPSIAYAQAQYGWLVRYDKASGEKVPIQPQPAMDQPGYRWNWDAPLLVSKHTGGTLYFAANKVFKSSNRGDDWTEISPDLTRQLDRNKLPVMGQVWSIDAVMKNASTTVYGNIVALDESPLKKGLLFVGTDDGLIQISNNDGKDWQKIEEVAGVPSKTRVNMLTASRFDENTVYAAFNNQRNGDFKPYLFKSINGGKTWVSISGNLPERGTVYCIKQDHIDPNLLFVGTEFGAYFTLDDGKNWTKLSGLPTVAVYDLEIQERENDLVAASFGRGFYVLDNYSPLRSLNATSLNKKAWMFPTKDALLYVPADPLGLEGTGFQGHNLWSAQNPAFGAVFTLHLKEGFSSLISKRQEKELGLEKEKKEVLYPSMEELRKEQLEKSPILVWLIKDSMGNEVRRFTSQPSKGIHRVVWNLRSNPAASVKGGDHGFLVKEGSYRVSVVRVGQEGIDTLVLNHAFNVKSLNHQTLAAKNPKELNQFRKEVAESDRKLSGLGEIFNELVAQAELMEGILLNYPNTDMTLIKRVRSLMESLEGFKLSMYGDALLAKHEFETPPSVVGRLETLQYTLYSNASGVSATQRKTLEQVNTAYDKLRKEADTMLAELTSLENILDQYAIPYTRYRRGNWKGE